MHACAFRQAIDKGEQQHAQDVVEDRGSQNNFCEYGRKHTHVAQHARRNAYAGCHQSRAHEDGFSGRITAPMHESKSQRKRNDDPDAGHQQSFSAYLDKVLRADFQASVEQARRWRQSPQSI